MQTTLHGELMCALAVVLYDYLKDFPKSSNFLCKNGHIYRWLWGLSTRLIYTVHCVATLAIKFLRLLWLWERSQRYIHIFNVPINGSLPKLS
jgi:hypothetical protein